jgi:hypothetical protein
MMLVSYLLCSLGVCYAWSDTEVTVPLRNLVARVPYARNMLLCHECSSFWISLGLSFLVNPMAEFAPPHFSNVLSAFCGFFINMAFTRKHWIPFKD